jgi:hypothetical protein
MSRRLLTTLVVIALSVACSKNPTSPTETEPPSSSGSCGTERWAVKTLSDPDATHVDFAHVVSTSVSALNALPPHCSSLPEGRTFAEELQVFEVTGLVTLARLEDDHDIHVVLADLTNRSRTIVTEVVDPACNGAAQSPFVSLSPLAGKTARVQGLGFYDFNHGQTGRSASCIELHPVTGSVWRHDHGGVGEVENSPRVIRARADAVP